MLAHQAVFCYTCSSYGPPSAKTIHNEEVSSVMAPTNTTRDSAAVIEVDERNFNEEVLGRSHEVPVVVDFWAPWCGPCRVLGPILERLAAEANGAFVLAKVNVDHNQRLAIAYQVQGIPAVKAFRDGQVVDEFTGALPESRVRAWLQRLTPAPADRLAAEAAALEARDPQAAAERYRAALAADTTHAASLFGLGRLLAARSDPEGIELLRKVPPGTPFYARAQAWLTLAELFTAASEADPRALAERIAHDPNDLEACYRLAAVYTREQRYADALAQLLAIVERDRAFRDDGARRAMLALFEILGDQDPLVAEYRRKLANALF
jgi:putative thioredoxin